MYLGWLSTVPCAKTELQLGYVSELQAQRLTSDVVWLVKI